LRDHRTVTRVLGAAILAAGCAFSQAAAAGQKDPLPSRYKAWLDEEVIYIILPIERQVLQKLNTDRERDLFIEAFWKQRDPTPGTPENEFRTEHARRIAYANRNYHRSTPLPGWKTDRGRMYIILGEPTDIERYSGQGQVNPSEVWFYQDKAALGLPSGFHLVFFQRDGIGDFRLYSPAKDGPQALIANYSGDRTDHLAAYKRLVELEAPLAAVSLSLIPGEGEAGLGRPSLASDVMIQKVENLPQAQVQGKYAQKFLDYKDIVEVEYTANYMDSTSMIKLVKDPSGLYFVHYVVEPKRLSLNAYENRFSAKLQLNGRVTTPDGRLIFQFEKPVDLAMDEERAKMANAQPLNLQDMFPLIPGTYRLSLLMKNEVSKEFTSTETMLIVPGDAPALQMTSPVLGFQTARVLAGKARLKPFQIGPIQVYCQPGRVFTRKDTLSAAFQVLGLTPEQKAGGLIRYTFMKDGQTWREKQRTLAEYAELPLVLEEFPLADFSPAYYDLRISVIEGGRELVTGTEAFVISQQEAVPRPWYFSKLLPEPSDPVYDQIIGTQLLNAERPAEAKPRLERAFRQKPEDADLAFVLARAYMSLGEATRVPPLLAPFLEPPRPPSYDVFVLTGQALRKMGDSAGALAIFERAILQFGQGIALLNAVGDCQESLGRPKEALAAWEKSLQFDPAQPEIRKRFEALKVKK
jgi:GWxTD domain-containing protein